MQTTGTKLAKLPVAKFALFDTYKVFNHYAPDMYNRANQIIQVLDLQDVHGLREARHKRFQEWSQTNPDILVPRGEPMWVERSNSEESKAINRADLVIPCSDFEHFHLKRTMPEINLALATFLLPMTQFL